MISRHTDYAQDLSRHLSARSDFNLLAADATSRNSQTRFAVDYSPYG